MIKGALQSKKANIHKSNKIRSIVLTTGVSGDSHILWVCLIVRFCTDITVVMENNIDRQTEMHNLYFNFLIQTFAWFKTMRRKSNLASALAIQKENWGNHAFFRENKASSWKKKTNNNKTLPYIALYFTAF